MKTLALTFALILTAFRANALNLNDIVLGVDMTDFELTTIFPCSSYQNIMFCNDQIVLEKTCAQTLEVSRTNGTLSCKSLSGKIEIFARVDNSTFFADPTNGGTGGYHLNYSKNVSLKEFTTPNAKTEWQIIVK